jgi:hypothetical protein
MPKRQVSNQTPTVPASADSQSAAEVVAQGLKRFSDNLQRFNNLREKVQGRFEQRNRKRPTR